MKRVLTILFVALGIIFFAQPKTSTPDLWRGILKKNVQGNDKGKNKFTAHSNWFNLWEFGVEVYLFAQNGKNIYSAMRINSGKVEFYND